MACKECVVLHIRSQNVSQNLPSYRERGASSNDTPSPTIHLKSHIVQGREKSMLSL